MAAEAGRPCSWTASQPPSSRTTAHLTAASSATSMSLHAFMKWWLWALRRPCPWCWRRGWWPSTWSPPFCRRGGPFWGLYHGAISGSWQRIQQPRDPRTAGWDWTLLRWLQIHPARTWTRPEFSRCRGPWRTTPWCACCVWVARPRCSLSWAWWLWRGGAYFFLTTSQLNADWPLTAK